MEHKFTADFWKSFKGTSNLYGMQALEQFAKSQVIVVGVGGVGSWAVESLARTGIGSIVLVDADDICLSNINRQLPALITTKGDPKTEVLEQRCKEINPTIDIQVIEQFLGPHNLQEIIKYHDFTLSNFQVTEQSNKQVYVIDAIDNASVKAALANFCRRNKYKLVVCGAAGGKKDLSKIRLADITETTQDPLLANVRNKLRREFDYRQRYGKKKFNLPAVYSIEQMTLPKNQQACDLKNLNCNNGYGSGVTVTATFANFAVSKILDFIAK